MRDLWQAISDIAVEIHPDRIEVLARRISSLKDFSDFENNINSFRLGISQSLIDILYDSWKQVSDIKPIEVAAALRGASAISTNFERNESIEMVWTGPSSGMVPSRHTEQVLIEVINSAQKKLYLVSFVAYEIDSVMSALRDATDRSVQIGFLLELSKNHGGKLECDSVEAFSKQLPSAIIYTWGTQARSADRWNGVIHAKCAVADGNVAFVTSANLTRAAMEKNMELGLLMRGGKVPDKLERHLDSLITTGIVEKV